MEIMLDLETLSTDSNAVVVSISAIEFDRYTGEMLNAFERRLNIQQQIEANAVMDSSTVMWWLEQSKEAQNELTRLPEHEVIGVLREFTLFCKRNNATAIWGNGATFDNVILRNLYHKFNLELPLGFWTDRDVRTLVDLAGIDTRSYEFDGVRHRGIDDCKHQIKYCVDAFNKLKI